MNHKGQQVLEAHGAAYKALYNGDTLPQTDAEQNFVNILKHGLTAASDDAKLWQKYLNAINHKKTFHAATSYRAIDVSVDNETQDSLDDPNQ